MACSPLLSRPQGSKSFFSEIIASISDIRFSRDGRYILSRDYMSVKLWDLAKEDAPVATLHVHEQLRQRVRLRRHRGSGPAKRGFLGAWPGCGWRARAGRVVFDSRTPTPPSHLCRTCRRSH